MNDIDIYIPVFNNIFCVEYQIKTLKAFSRHNPTNIFIVDNNMEFHPDNSEKVKKICEENQVHYIFNDDPIIRQMRKIEGKWSSLQHGRTFNFLFHNIIRERKPTYFGFLDADCFAVRPFDFSKYLEEKNVYGKVVPTHVDENQHRTFSGDYAWNIHVVCNFFKFSTVSEKQLDFMAGGDRLLKRLGVRLDTGGMNYEFLYKDLDKREYVLPEEHYYYYDNLKLLDPNLDKPTNVLYEIIDETWFHMVHSPAGKEENLYMNPKISYAKGFLDCAMLNYGVAGAKVREDFIPTYRDPNRHYTFN